MLFSFPILPSSTSASLAPITHHHSPQRLIGFATCLSIGILFGALGSLFVLVSPRKFAALYTLSNLLSLGATCFLVGPAKQARSMCKPTRAPAAVVYLASLVLTLVAALKWRSLVLTVAALAVQVCALAWYALSFIPYARTVASAAVGRCFGLEGW